MRIKFTLFGSGLWAVALLAGAAAPAVASSYSAGAVICGNGQTQAPSALPAAVSIGNYACGNGSYGSAGARADSGGIGVAVDFYSFGQSATAQAQAQINTTFVVNGPGTAPIPISINFLLSGFLGGGTSANSVSYRQIENRAIVSANYAQGTQVHDFYGRVVEIFNSSLDPGLSAQFSGNLAPAGSNCLAPSCPIQSPIFNVYPGYTNDLVLWARATVDSANGSGYGIASFLNTFYFPTGGPVFNLPDGYSVTIEGLNVVNNRVVGNDDGSVPEPSTYSLIAAGLAALWLSYRR